MKEDDGERVNTSNEADKEEKKDRIDRLILNAKCSNQMQLMRFSGILQGREFTRVNQNASRLLSEISHHSSWLKSMKQYVNYLNIRRPILWWSIYLDKPLPSQQEFRITQYKYYNLTI